MEQPPSASVTWLPQLSVWIRPGFGILPSSVLQNATEPVLPESLGNNLRTRQTLKQGAGKAARLQESAGKRMLQIKTVCIPAQSVQVFNHQFYEWRKDTDYLEGRQCINKATVKRIKEALWGGQPLRGGQQDTTSGWTLMIVSVHNKSFTYMLPLPPDRSTL